MPGLERERERERGREGGTERTTIRKMLLIVRLCEKKSELPVG